MSSLRVPADWEPQRAIWMAWPHNEDTWPNRFDPIPDCFRQIIGLISETVPVHLIGRPEHRNLARLHSVASSDRVQWVDVTTNDCWVRDYGPTFLLGSQNHAIDWNYNAWGGKYPPWENDDAAAAAILQHAGWHRIKSELCLEGGALEWDGAGRLLTTSKCLVTPSRNPGWTRSQIAAELERVAGATEIVWVDGGGLQGDDTDGHIDQLARFIDPEHLVVATACDSSDPNHKGLQENLRLLTQWGRHSTPPVHVHSLPLPPARFIDGTRVPESYCNFLRLGPNRILVPTFGQPQHDDRALEIIQQLAEQRHSDCEVIGVDCRDLVWGLGALHCASLNEPQR